MNTQIWKTTVRERGASVFRGKFDHEVEADSLRGPELINVFLDDDDIIEMTVTSSNIGFTRTITKQFQPLPAESSGTVLSV